MQPATARHTALIIPTYLRQPERRLPNIFKDDWLNCYPDTQDDILGGPKVDKPYDAIVLENEFLRLTILPELGGKLWSVFDKQAGEEAIYVPDCIKPGLIHRAGAWIPGGMEFNFPVGHHIRTMRPLPCAILKTGPEEAVALVERVCARSGLRMELRIGLKAGEARLSIDGELFNPTALRHRWYQWTNVGCWAHEKWRFFSKAETYFTGNSVKKYPVDKDGVDISWVKDRPMPCDSFMVAHREDFFGCYDYAREHGICHVAPWQELQGKKYFTWGMEYREYDSAVNMADDGRNYLEIQTGPMETQGDHALLEPGQATAFHAVWIPFRQIGGIEWADRDLIFHVRDETGWLYAAVDGAVEVSVGARKYRYQLAAGQVQKLPVAVRRGDRVALRFQGALRREFTYPLKGRQEPGGEKRWREKKYWEPLPEKPTAQEQFEYGLRVSRGDSQPGAIRHFRAALKLDPKLHAARLALADALWHLGDFAAGAREFQALLKTPLKEQAALYLARRAEAEAFFAASYRGLPSGPGRDLAQAERLAGYGNFAAALAIYQRLLKLEPDQPRVHYGLARYYAYVLNDRKRMTQHAERALALQPGDRDMLLEMGPILRLAGRYDLLRAAILRAPRAVRELAIVQKLLLFAQFELGEYAAAFAIGANRRLYNWEGEFDHADAFQDATLALLETALRRGDAAAIKKYETVLHGWPRGLGLLRRFLNQPKAGYWIGRVLERAGHTAEAQQVWRTAVAEFKREQGLIAATHGDYWRQWFSPQISFLYARIAQKLGDAALVEEAVALILGPPPDAKLQARLKHPAFRKKHQARHLLRDGLVAELRGDFATAQKLLGRYSRTATETRIAKLHLAAMKRGVKYGD